MLSLLFATLAALANAFSSVLQRKSARMIPAEDTGGLRVVLAQLHHKVWYAGIASMLAAFLFQATALSSGSLALVQPVLAVELPITLILAVLVFGGGLGRREWLAIVLMTAGLAVALFAAQPTDGRTEASGPAWTIGAGGAAIVLVIAAVVAWHLRGSARAAALGCVSGGLFGLTATFMATTAAHAKEGVVPLFSSWQPYAMAVAGVAALIVLQQAYGAGQLTAAQPGVTIIDPVVAVILGIVIFDERIRLGWLIGLEVAGVLAVVLGAVLLSGSTLLHQEPAVDGAGTPAELDDLQPVALTYQVGAAAMTPRAEDAFAEPVPPAVAEREGDRADDDRAVSVAAADGEPMADDVGTACAH